VLRSDRGKTPANLWRNADFLKFWFGETFSLVGSQVTGLALPLTALHAFGATDEQIGLLRFLQLAPYLGLALVFGVLVDRARRRHLMLGANLVRMVLVALIPTLYWLGALDMTAILALACAIGIASVLFDVSWMSYVPTLVRDPQHYVEASSKMGASSSAAEVAGPGLAGMLVSVLTAPVALVVDAVTYLMSIASLLLIRAREPRPAPAPRRHMSRELGDGLRWVLTNPILRWLAITGFCCNFSTMTVWTLFLLYGTRGLLLGPVLLGGVLAAGSIGGLVGAVVSRRLIERVPIGLLYLAAHLAVFLGPTLIVVAAGPRPVMVGLIALSFFISYFGLGVGGVIVISLRQTSTPQSMMGRMTAVFRTLLFGGGALGGMAAGLLAGAVGAGNALAITAVGSAALMAGVAVSPVIALRRLPEPTAETEGRG
jgi:predicted MFS family arabinose efflux permease